MPEGPSIVILKETVQKLGLEGQKVVAVTGNSSVDFSGLTGHKVERFESWGKHFLICFEHHTIRIHFMLFGTYRINERKDTPARFSLLFPKDELNFYACSVKLIDRNALEVYDWSADIMADKWDLGKALDKLSQVPDALVCDALLDQHIFSGSGNIIKNEVLFRTKVHPLSKVGSIPKKLLKTIAAEVRIYSFQFLDWKRAFTLKQHWLAHTKKICPRCNIPLKKEYLGVTKRRSFFCEHCQKLY